MALEQCLYFCSPASFHWHPRVASNIFTIWDLGFINCPIVELIECHFPTARRNTRGTVNVTRTHLDTSILAHCGNSLRKAVEISTKMDEPSSFAHLLPPFSTRGTAQELPKIRFSFKMFAGNLQKA